MTRTEQLKHCKVCLNQKFDLNQGIICSLTNEKADFEDQCDTFEENKKLPEKVICLILKLEQKMFYQAKASVLQIS